MVKIQRVAVAAFDTDAYAAGLAAGLEAGRVEGRTEVLRFIHDLIVQNERWQAESTNPAFRRAMTIKLETLRTVALRFEAHPRQRRQYAGQ